MAEFYIPVEMKRSLNENISFRLKVWTEVDFAQAKTTFYFRFQYQNKSEATNLDTYKVQIAFNDTEVVDSRHYSIPIYATGEEWQDFYYQKSHSVYHDASGGGSYVIEASVKADPVDALELLLINYYKTVGSATYNGALEQINLSNPEITDFKIYGDRYGLNVGTSFKASHSVYNITSIVFELTGLTYEQANARVGKVTEADSSARFTSGDTYGLRLKKTRNLTSSNEILFNLDAVAPSSSPLDSGGTYYFSLEITAENGKTHLIAGDFTLPQKVTELTCDSNIEMLPKTSQPLNYSVLPTNAEEQRVRFDTTDPTVATVDNEGNITALADGVCQIIVTTVDGGFTAACTVTVVNTEVFPTLGEIRILTSTDISRIAFACKFVRNELIAKGITVPELADTQAQGKGHPIKQIKSLLETIEANCQILRAASPFEITTLTAPQTINKYNEDWYIVVNTWIAFLNEIHLKINGGG